MIEYLFDFQTPPIHMILIACIGYCAAISAWIWIIIIAYKKSSLEGMLFVFLPFYFFYFIFKYIEDVRMPIMLYAAGWLLVIIVL